MRERATLVLVAVAAAMVVVAAAADKPKEKPLPLSGDMSSVRLADRWSLRETVFDEPLEVPFYGHGASMGTLPSLVKDPKWMEILSLVYPDYMQFYTRALVGNFGYNLASGMKGVENNPVLAAYAYERQRELGMPGAAKTCFEWDIFVPPEMDAHNVVDTVDDLLIAHGTTVQTVQEGMRSGSAGRALIRDQYEAALATPTYKLGGVKLGEWKNMFALSLLYSRTEKSSWWMVKKHAGKTFTWKAFIEEWRRDHPSRAQWFPVVLDVKSKSVDASMLALIAMALNDLGVEVRGIGSFSWQQIGGVTRRTKQLLGKKIFPKESVGVINEPLRPILFFHGLKGRVANKILGDPQLLDPDHAENIPMHTSIMFNAGVLIDDERLIELPFQTGKWAPVQESLDALRNLKRARKFSFGLYVQEYDIGVAPLDTIIKMCNNNKDLFDMGFAWGGFPDRWYKQLPDDQGLAGQKPLAQSSD